MWVCPWLIKETKYLTSVILLFSNIVKFFDCKGINYIKICRGSCRLALLMVVVSLLMRKLIFVFMIAILPSLMIFIEIQSFLSLSLSFARLLLITLQKKKIKNNLSKIFQTKEKKDLLLIWYILQIRIITLKAPWLDCGDNLLLKDKLNKRLFKMILIVKINKKTQ